MQKQWTVEVVRCINKWAKGGWYANEMIWTKSMHKWPNEPMNPWINESMNQWINEPILIQWMNKWISESMKEWMSESRNQWVSEWMDGWVSYFLVELLLHWATSSLRYLFSQLLLLWAASYVGYLCSEMIPSYLFCTFCNPSLLFVHPAQCVLQPPAAIPNSTRIALWSKTSSHAASATRLAPSSCKPA